MHCSGAANANNASELNLPIVVAAALIPREATHRALSQFDAMETETHVSLITQALGARSARTRRTRARP